MTTSWITRAAIAAILFGVCAPAQAHPIPFSYVDVTLQPDALELTIVAHVFDVAHDLGVAPPERLLEPATLALRTDAIASLLRSRLQIIADGKVLTASTWTAPEALGERQSLKLRVRYPLARPAGTVAVAAEMFPYDPQHRTFVNVYERGAIASQAILDQGHTRFEYFSGSRQGVLAVLQKFVPAGIHHILIGPDHLMFLVGLLLLGGSIRRLLLVVTAFTLAHSITLSLAVLRIVTPSPGMIEPAIALSVVYVGADNLLVRSGGRDMRAWIAFAFGFIHGFGFANVLREMDLPARALGWTLFGFNVGVEIGQLLVVVTVASVLTLIRSHSEVAGRRLAFAGSIAVMAAGAFWFIQRVFFPGGMA
jgi:hydrogenase/urease accessory protein HupE